MYDINNKISKMEEFVFDYDSEDDVLYITSAEKEVDESIEFSEDIILDLDKEGNIISIEIFYASEFFCLFNNEINKNYLETLKSVSLLYKEFRNRLFIFIVLESDSKKLSFPLPLMKRLRYITAVN